MKKLIVLVFVFLIAVNINADELCGTVCKVSDGDTINGLTQTLKVPIEQIARQNDTIYLLPDQLIVYKR